MKRIYTFLLILFIFGCSEPKQIAFHLGDHIPADTELFIMSPELDSLNNHFSKNHILNSIDFELKEKLQEDLEFLPLLKFRGQSAISFSNIDMDQWIYTIITEKDSGFVVLDSIQNKSVEDIEQDGISFKKMELEGAKFFLYETESATILSNSKQRIIDFEDETKLMKDDQFLKVLEAADPKKTSLIFSGKAERKLFDIAQGFNLNLSDNLAKWTILDLDISDNHVLLNGISLSSQPDFIENFLGSRPQEIEMSKICPENFISLMTISFKDFENIKSQTDSLSKKVPGILNYIREIGAINLTEGFALALNTHDIEIAKEQISGVETEIYRGTPIFKIETATKLEDELDFITFREPLQFYTVMDHFLIFSANSEVVKNMIAAVQNSATLESNAHFQEIKNSISSQSSLLFVANLPKHLAQSNKESQLKNFTLAAYQVIAEDNFSHVHGIISQPSRNSLSTGGVEQVATFTVDAPISGNPQFFKNHLSDQQDIAVQDINNTLYLMSNKGSVFWKKTLDSNITSPIFQVDLFKNGNKQLAFSTGYNLEVIDRTGKDVKTFPKKFNDALTQPLAVFDYDNNRKYRFILTQGKKVYMLGPKGNSIKGFDFEKAKSEIVKSPKHVRLGNKDYILIAEESGKLNILSRQGSIRVPVTENIKFSENDWYGYDSKFVSTEPDQNIIEITQSGTVSKKNLGLAENNRIVAEDDILVYLNENELIINGKSISLDFGLYTDPQLFQIKRRSLVSITDMQTKKVYVFDKNGDLMPGFPVFGTSGVDISNADLDSRLEMIVKGDENEILLYKL